MTRRQRAAAVGGFLAWALAYAAAMYVGRVTRMEHSGLSLVWPAAGLGTVWLLSIRGRVPAVLAVTVCALIAFVVSLPTGSDLAEAFNVAAVVTVHPVVAVLVLRVFGWRDARPPLAIGEIPVLFLSAVTAGVATAVAGVAIAYLRFGEMWWEGAWQLSSRNTVSGFVATLVLLAVPRLGARVGPAGPVERVLLVSLTLVGTVAVMSLQLPLLYLLVPLTVMVAMRCGPYLTSVLVGVQGVLVVVGTMRADGALVELLSPEVRVLLAQLLIMVLAVLGLVIAQEEVERTEALERRREDRDRLRDHIDAALVANAHLAVRPDVGMVVTTVNPALATLCRTDRDGLLAADPLTWFDPAHRETVSAAVDDLRQRRALAWRGELQMDRAFGGGWVDAALSPVRSRAGHEVGVNVQLLDITARKRAEDRLATLALHDQLTGLPNRTLVGDRLDVALAQTRRTGIPVAVLYVDVDHFKSVNDTRGHDGGDSLLVQFAQRIGRIARAQDTVGRMGGDEFVVVCPAIGDVTQAREVAARVLRVLDEPFLIGGEPLVVTASVGVTVSDGQDGDARDVLRHADDALYLAKDHGRSRFELFSAETHAEAERSVRLLDELREAFAFGDLVLEYQPIVELATREPAGLEALVRWQHPTRGLLPPREFLDVLESSDLVFRLGELALRTACQEGAALVAAGYPLVMHVNLSARELERPAIVDTVRNVLAETGFPPRLLALEMTETRMLTVSGSLLRDLAELRRLGVRIAVDDFGTGYSGPAHLVQMPVDVLKLDRSFVAGVEDQRSAQAVSAGVLAMARGLGVGVIAEGVETDSQERVLLELGYELGQGYLYAAALPASRIGDWLRDHAAA